MPSIETSGVTGEVLTPPMVSSSAASSALSCKVTRWVRKNSSAARTTRASVTPSRAMQRALDRAGLRRRDQLRPRQIDLKEFVGQFETAALVAVEQVVAAGYPE